MVFPHASVGIFRVKTSEKEPTRRVIPQLNKSYNILLCNEIQNWAATVLHNLFDGVAIGKHFIFKETPERILEWMARFSSQQAPVLRKTNKNEALKILCYIESTSFLLYVMQTLGWSIYQPMFYCFSRCLQFCKWFHEDKTYEYSNTAQKMYQSSIFIWW